MKKSKSKALIKKPVVPDFVKLPDYTVQTTMASTSGLAGIDLQCRGPTMCLVCKEKLGPWDRPEDHKCP